MVRVVRPRPEVVHPEFDVTALGCPADERNPQRREVLRKDRDDVYAHRDLR
jgi:hypothetical protein